MRRPLCYTCGMEFKTTRTVRLGGRDGIREIFLGGGNPVTVQTMWKEGISGAAEDSARLERIARDMDALKSLGCDIIRFAVPDEPSARSLRVIQGMTDIPLVADIHFDWRLALACLDDSLPGRSVSAVRINPGNIGGRERVEAVVEACRARGAAMRVGVNSGSIPRDLEAGVMEGRMSRAEALRESALREVSVLDALGFHDVVVSMKASSVKETVEANEVFAAVSDIPLHIGVTEAGPLITGVVRSTMALGRLLDEGIGATVRVSLSSSPENEVIAAREILHECGKRDGGVTLVSCPRCGREGFDVHGFMERWQNRLLSMRKDVTVAVMGCAVNGPGEGKHADLGIAGGGGKAVLFRRGKILRTIDEKDADAEFEKELALL